MRSISEYKSPVLLYCFFKNIKFETSSRLFLDIYVILSQVFYAFSLYFFSFFYLCDFISSSRLPCYVFYIFYKFYITNIISGYLCDFIWSILQNILLPFDFATEGFSFTLNPNIIELSFKQQVKNRDENGIDTVVLCSVQNLTEPFRKLA